MIEVYLCELPKEKNRTVLEKLLPNVSAEKQGRIKKKFKSMMHTITLTDMNTGKAITDFTCKQYKINNQYRLSVCANHDNMNHFTKLPFLVSFNKICNDLKISLA